MADRPMINHSEMVFRPGDREAAWALFETMGFWVGEIPGFPWIAVNVDAAITQPINTDNVLWANESTPAQQNVEAALEAAMANDSDLAAKIGRYLEIRRAHPQYVHHFGASVPTHEDWQQRVDNLREANESHPLLKGRLDLDVREAGDPTALGGASQLFLHTDIIQVGVAQLGGLLFDLQWSPSLEVLAATMPTEFPDRLAMV